jgi:hypothetical protein
MKLKKSQALQTTLSNVIRKDWSSNFSRVLLFGFLINRAFLLFSNTVDHLSSGIRLFWKSQYC